MSARFTADAAATMATSISKKRKVGGCRRSRGGARVCLSCSDVLLLIESSGVCLLWLIIGRQHVCGGWLLYPSYASDE